MDAESLAQVQYVVTSAVASAVGSLRQEFAAGFTELRQEIESTRTASRQELASAVADLHREILDSREEVKRHTGVLIEDLHSKLDLVVEGLEMHIERRHVEEREYTDNQFHETRALIQLSYQQLHHRVEVLEPDVSGLKHRLDNSA